MFVKTVMIAQTNSSYWSISSQLTRSTNTPSNLRYITWVFMQFFQVAKDYIQDMLLLSLVFFSLCSCSSQCDSYVCQRDMEHRPNKHR